MHDFFARYFLLVTSNVAFTDDNHTVEFFLGIQLQIAWDYQLIYGCAMAEIEFRKHLSPSLVQRFGSPLLPFGEELDPRLRIRLLIGNNFGYTAGAKSEQFLSTSKLVADYVYGLNGQPKVSGIIGSYSFLPDQAAATIAYVQGIPVIGTGAMGGPVSNRELYPLYFRTSQGIELSAGPMARYFVFMGWRTAAFIYADGQWGYDHLTEITNYLRRTERSRDIKQILVDSELTVPDEAAAAAQARLLKMLLSRKTSSQVFVDSDDLINLDELFDTVRFKLKNLVAYLTRDTLTRPWCAGEIVVATQVGLNRIALHLPSFRAPTEEDFGNLTSYLDLSGCNLEEYGILLSDVSQAFRVLLTALIKIPEATTGTSRFDIMTDSIISGKAKELELKQSSPPSKVGVLAISADFQDDEAVATAYILATKLKEPYEQISDKGIHCLIDYSEDYDAQAELIVKSRVVLVLLSQGSMQRLPQIEAIFHGTTSNGPLMIPVVIPGFVFPCNAYYEILLPQIWHSDNLQEGRSSLQKLFKKIAVSINTSAHEHVIDIACLHIMQRIPVAFSERKALEITAIPSGASTTPDIAFSMTEEKESTFWV